MPKTLKNFSTSSTTNKTSILETHRKVSQDIIERLRSSRRVLIGIHEHPDGDAVGSSLALLHSLRLQGKEVVIYAPDAAPDYLNFLPGFDQLAYHKPDTTTFDTIVILDCTKLFRAHLKQEVLAHPNTIVIDHHQDNPGRAHLNLIATDAAATAHILYELFLSHQVPITRDIATCLLTGIFTDTGSFMHDSTTPAILEIASELMSKGARLSHIAHETYQKKDLASLRIWGIALSRVIVNSQTGAAVSVITYADLDECNATLEDLSGVVNMLNTLPQTKFALLLTEYRPGLIKGSLRSEPHKGVDVSQIASRLGGGGHKLASGFEIKGHLVKRDNQWRIARTKIEKNT